MATKQLRVQVLTVDDRLVERLVPDTPLQRWLNRHGACGEARVEVGERTLYEAYQHTRNTTWLRWFLRRIPLGPRMDGDALNSPRPVSLDFWNAAEIRQAYPLAQLTLPLSLRASAQPPPHRRRHTTVLQCKQTSSFSKPPQVLHCDSI